MCYNNFIKKGKFCLFFKQRGEKMRTAGIIAEYNPFHNGHKYHIEKTREVTGAEGIIVVMSGSFVQRGDVAICDKWSRSKMALLGGADLVVELPCVYSCQSAEYFARGAVSILEHLKCDFLSFGTESDSTDDIIKTAEFLKNPDYDFKNNLEINLKNGISYPKALANALGNDLVNTPNNVLAIEYIKQIKNMRPIGIKRKGSLHDGDGSASDIREQILKDNDVKHLMPESSYEILKSSDLANRDIFEKLLLYKLRMMNTEQLKNVPDVTEGLENRILQMAHKCATVGEMCDSVKTKRYTMARIRRIMTNALLDITKEDILNPPEYIRILGMNNVGMEILRQLRDKTDIPVVTKVADANVSKMLEKDINSTNIYSVLTGKASMMDFTTSPIIF